MARSLEWTLTVGVGVPELSGTTSMPKPRPGLLLVNHRRAKTKTSSVARRWFFEEVWKRAPHGVAAPLVQGGRER